MVLERAAIDLAAQKPARAAAIVQADIDAALVRDIGRTTLGAATANCTDLTKEFNRLGFQPALFFRTGSRRRS